MKRDSDTIVPIYYDELRVRAKEELIKSHRCACYTCSISVAAEKLGIPNYELAAILRENK